MSSARSSFLQCEPGKAPQLDDFASSQVDFGKVAKCFVNRLDVVGNFWGSNL